MAIPESAIKIITSKNNSYFKDNRITLGTSAPTSGTYKAGDLVISSSANSTSFAWVCTTGGTPGTWKELSSGSDVNSMAWTSITGKPSTFTPTLGTTATTAFRGDYGNTAYNHAMSTHAPTNAQKNSDITKAEIEAKLTGNITTHTHDSRYYTETEVDDIISGFDLYDDNSNIYVKNSDGILGSGLHGTIVRYISPTTFSEFLEMTRNPGVYYVLNKVTTTYSNKTVTILGLIDSRKSGSNYSYYGIQKMNQFVVNSSGQITNYSQLTEYILNQIPSTYAGSSSAGGSATSADKVNKALTIQANGTPLGSFDGSVAKTFNITASGIGAATSSHTHNYAGSSSAGGAATSAEKLSNPITISVIGDVENTVTFDGSEGEKTLTLRFKRITSAPYFNGFVTIDEYGKSNIGKYIDFHNTSNTTYNYNTRIACNNTGTNILTLPTSSGTIALTSDIDSAIGNINSLLDELNGTSI